MTLANPENEIGNIVTRTISIEKYMDKILSIHFCESENKRDEFSSMILFNERITFDFKKNILSILLKKHYNNILINNPNLLKLLSDVPEHRNRFAHLETVGYSHSNQITSIIESKTPVYNGLNQDKMLDMATPYYIIFKSYKNGNPKYIGYSLNDLIELGNQSMELLKGFKELFLLVSKSDLPTEQGN
ncbi:MAG: hypothetical protein ABI166_01705 [Mucilaginibacter sp.]